MDNNMEPTANVQGEATQTAAEQQQNRADLAMMIRHTQRTKRIVVRSARELGALLRVARQRLEMSQTDAALCCNVGRRFYIELENGKSTVQLDKVLDVLNALGMTLALGGAGAAFTPEQLATACLKLKRKDPDHVWEAEFSDKIEAPYEETPADNYVGRRPGSVENRYKNRISRVRTEKGLFELDKETKNLVPVKDDGAAE